jgi:hypothetical protein
MIKQSGLVFALALRLWVLKTGFVRMVQVFDGTIFSGEAAASVIPWVPAHRWLAYFTGAAFLAASLAFVANIRQRLTAILLGTLFRLSVLFLQTPGLILFGARTNSIKGHAGTPDFSLKRRLLSFRFSWKWSSSNYVKWVLSLTAFLAILILVGTPFLRGECSSGLYNNWIVTLLASGLLPTTRRHGQVRKRPICLHLT